MNDYLLTAIVGLGVGISSYIIGTVNAKTTEFKELITAYDKICNEMRFELDSAKQQIHSLREEITECHRVIEQLRNELHSQNTTINHKIDLV